MSQSDKHPVPAEDVAREAGLQTTQVWLPGDDTTEESLADAQLAYLLDVQLSALESNQTPPPPGKGELGEFQPVLRQLHDLAMVLGGTAYCSSPAAERGHSKLGEPLARIGKYEPVRRLGEGGQASAHLAFDPDLHRHVVIKVYRDARTPQDQEAILAEGRSLARIRSPYVAQVYAAERHEGIPYLVVEYVAGKNLQELMQAKRIDFDQALAIVGKLAEGLAEVHACGLLHRDLKPSNVMMGDDGQPKLVDFGLAAAFGTEALRRISGTLAFMAPEQARGESERIDPRSDLYGLGAVLYALVTGQPPHQGETREALWQAAKEGEIVPPRQLQPRLPATIENVIMKCLAKDPSQRYSSARELADALRSIQDRRDWLAKRSQPARFTWALLAMGGVAAALVAFALLLPTLRMEGQATTVAHNTPPEDQAKNFQPVASKLAVPDAPQAAVPAPPATPRKHPDGHVLRADFPIDVEALGGRPDGDGVLHLVEDDVLVLRMRARRDCYVAVCAVDHEGNVTRLFPNEREKNQFLKAGEWRVVPDPELAKIRATPSTGKEYVYALAASEPWTPVEGRRVGDGGTFTAFFSKEEKDRVRGEFETVRGLKLELSPDATPKSGAVSEVVIPFFVKAKE